MNAGHVVIGLVALFTILIVADLVLEARRRRRRQRELAQWYADNERQQ